MVWAWRRSWSIEVVIQLRIHRQRHQNRIRYAQGRMREPLPQQYEVQPPRLVPQRLSFEKGKIERYQASKYDFNWASLRLHSNEGTITVVFFVCMYFNRMLTLLSNSIIKRRRIRNAEHLYLLPIWTSPMQPSSYHIGTSNPWVVVTCWSNLLQLTLYPWLLTWMMT